MDPSFIWNELIPALNDGLILSLLLIIPSACLGLLLGILAGFSRTFGPSWLSRIASAYATVFRGTPLLVQLFMLYFGLPGIGIYLTPYVAAIAGFSLCSGAYHSEYIRGALLSIKSGQIRAAESLGFSRFRTMVHIVLPQAMRRALPGVSNELIYLIKYSSLAYIITCIELTGEAKILAAQTFRYTEVFLIVGCYYLLLVSLASVGLRKLEDMLRVPGYGKG